MTLELIRQHMAQGAAENDLLFQIEQGKPIVHAEWDGEKLKRSDAIKCSWWRVQQKRPPHPPTVASHGLTGHPS